MFEAYPPPAGCFQCWSRGPNPEWTEGAEVPAFVWFTHNQHPGENECDCACHEVGGYRMHPSRRKK